MTSPLYNPFPGKGFILLNMLGKLVALIEFAFCCSRIENEQRNVDEKEIKAKALKAQRTSCAFELKLCKLNRD